MGRAVRAPQTLALQELPLCSASLAAYVGPTEGRVGETLRPDNDAARIRVGERIGLTAMRRAALPGKDFAFPKQRKEPLEGVSHVRDAIARFDQVEGVTIAERDAAWNCIRPSASGRSRRIRVAEAWALAKGFR